MRLLESGEDYLERILMLKEKHGNVRAIDIANSMNFSKPSVSIALHKWISFFLCLRPDRRDPGGARHRNQCPDRSRLPCASEPDFEGSRIAGSGGCRKKGGMLHPTL